MTKETIIQLSPYASPYGGNFIASLTALGEALEQNGWRQVWVFPEGAAGRSWLEQLYAEGKSIYLLPQASLLRTGKAIERIVNLENAQIIHNHFSNFQIPSLLAKKLREAKGYNCDLIWHHHSTFPVTNAFYQDIKDSIKFGIFGRNIHHVAVSAWLLQEIMKRGLRSQKKCVIPNGIDGERILHTTESRNSVRQRLNIDDDEIMLLQLGWDPYIKGIDIALKAVKQLIDRGLKIKLFVVGSEPSLEIFFKDHSAGGQPSWLGILAPIENIGNYFNAADIFISASRGEGFPYALAEAMYFGLPVVSSQIGGTEWLKEFSGVELFPSEDPEALENAILKVSRWSPEEKEELIVANRNLIRENYLIDIWVNRIINLYKEILG